MNDQAQRLRQLVDDKTEYMPQQNAEQPMQAMSTQGTRVLAVTSGKGGVGKTNLTVNLAIALGMAGQRVLVIDADLGMANVDVVLGSMSKKHLLNLLEDQTELEDVLMQGPYGVNYISGGSGIEKAAEFTYEERQLLMHKLAGCGRLADIILIDTGAGLGKNVMDFVLAADEVLLVDVDDAKLELARRMWLGATVNSGAADAVALARRLGGGLGADLVIEAAGAPATFEQALLMARPLGRVVILGNPSTDVTLARGTVSQLLRKELTLHGTWNSSFVALPTDEWRVTLRYLADRRIDVKPLITDTFRFADSVEAFDFAVNMPPTSVKAQIIVAE